MSKMIFKYPKEENNELEKPSYAVRKSRKKLAVIFLIDIISFCAFAISGMEIFIFLVIVLTVFLYFSLRFFLSAAEIYKLFITAYDDYFQIEKYDFNLKTVEAVELFYDDISEARYDKSCCSICLMYDDGKISKRDFNGNPLPVHKDGVINYSVSLYSWEQFFFLYVLSEKVNIKIRNNHKATAKSYIKKKFGKSESYIAKFLMSE